MVIEHQPLQAYNLNVANFHTYYIQGELNFEGVWVHNNCFDELPKNAKPTGETLADGRKVYTTLDANGNEIKVYPGLEGRWYDLEIHAPTFRLAPGEIRPGGELTGRKTTIAPQASLEKQRSLMRENESAETLSKFGFKVKQNPTVEGSKKPDYLIDNGEIFDCYAPSGGNVRNIASEIGNKVFEGQADNVVLNLSDSIATLSGIKSQLSNYPIPGLKKLIVLDKNGGVTVINFQKK